MKISIYRSIIRECFLFLLFLVDPVRFFDMSSQH